MDLPFEIWLNIARLIPLHELQRLASVNRALFSIAMDERFKLLRFRHRKKIINNVLLLRRVRSYKHHAQCVRRLEIWPQIIPKLAGNKPISRWGRLQNAVSRRMMGRPDATTQATAAMIDIISEMTNLTEYVHRCWDCTDLPELATFSPVVQVGWAAFGHNLRVLMLNIALEGYKYILYPLLMFPCLETLAINISQAYRTTDCSVIMSNLLVPFINNHYMSLRTLEISSYDYLNLGPLFNGLQHITNLTKLKINYRFASFGQTDTTGLHHILQLHSSSLQELDVRFRRANDALIERPLPCKWFQQDFLHIQLPSLKCLTLGMDYFAADLYRTADYIKQYQNTLTRLSLRSAAFTVSEVNILLSAFSGTDLLRKLEIDVYQLSPELFDLLAIKAPSLHYLKLGFDRFLSTLELDHFPVILESFRQMIMFCEALGTRKYSGWKLRHLYARPSRRLLGDTSECRFVISKALPNLETLQLEWPESHLKR